MDGWTYRPQIDQHISVVPSCISPGALAYALQHPMPYMSTPQHHTVLPAAQSPLPCTADPPCWHPTHMLLSVTRKLAARNSSTSCRLTTCSGLAPSYFSPLRTAVTNASMPSMTPPPWSSA